MIAVKARRLMLMDLVVDIGNTDTKFGVFRDDVLASRWVVHSDVYRDTNEHTTLLKAMLSHIGATEVDSAIVGSVVPELTERMADAVATAIGRRPRIARSQDVQAIDLDVDVPSQVGIDRVANALAAREVYTAPAIVADLGSVTTFDIVNDVGNLAGVVIALGMQNSARALTAAGAQLPSITLAKPARLIGTNTEASMHAGIYWGYVHMVRGLITHLRSELGTDYQIVATGGYAHVVANDVALFDVVDSELTLRGLLLIGKDYEAAK